MPRTKRPTADAQLGGKSAAIVRRIRPSNGIERWNWAAEGVASAARDDELRSGRARKISSIRLGSDRGQAEAESKRDQFEFGVELGGRPPGTIGGFPATGLGEQPAPGRSHAFGRIAAPTAGAGREGAAGAAATSEGAKNDCNGPTNAAAEGAAPVTASRGSAQGPGGANSAVFACPRVALLTMRQPAISNARRATAKRPYVRASNFIGPS